MELFQCVVLAVLETHLSNEEEKRIILTNPQLHFIFAPGLSNSCGAALVFRRDTFESIEPLHLNPMVDDDNIDNTLTNRACAALA